MILERFNLRPQERRLVVAIAMAVFVVLNMVFVWPHFGDWQMFLSKKSQSEKTLRLYQDEVARTGSYKTKLAKLQSSGSEILSQELDLVRVVSSQATANGIILTDTQPRTSTSSKTNRFFEEQLLSIVCTTFPNELVNFLVTLASGSSMIRVREMTLHPSPDQTKLQANMTVVASYQKKLTAVTGPKASVSPAKAQSAGVKPGNRTNSVPLKSTAVPKKTVPDTVKKK